MFKRIAVVSALLLLAMQANAGCYSEGTRIGVIQKFSMKGLITKSWEGEMVQEGLRVKAKGRGAGVTNIWRFSVTSPAVAKKIDDAMFAGGEVAVRYCQTLIKNPLTQNTSYEVTDVSIRK